MVRVKADPAFRGELIVEATNAFLMGNMETGKALLRDYLNATENPLPISSGNCRSTRRACAICSVRKGTRPSGISSAF
ncbi:MAG: hypothetical protein ACYC5X_18065 [Syntrophales bacterium]